VTAAWITAALVVVTVAHLGLLVAVLWARGLGAGGADPSVYHHEEGLECAACGTLNEEGYRFCRRCASELPDQGGLGWSGPRPGGRRTF
jgi:hypothetical protein